MICQDWVDTLQSYWKLKISPCWKRLNLLARRNLSRMLSVTWWYPGTDQPTRLSMIHPYSSNAGPMESNQWNGFIPSGAQSTFKPNYSWTVRDVEKWKGRCDSLMRAVNRIDDVSMVCDLSRNCSSGPNIAIKHRKTQEAISTIWYNPRLSGGTLHCWVGSLMTEMSRGAKWEQPWTDMLV